MKLRSVLRLCFALFSLSLLQHCGEPYREQEVKHYVLGFTKIDGTTDRRTIEAAFRKQVDHFNASAGFTALEFTTDPGAINSPLEITAGLQNSDVACGQNHHVACGQWITTEVSPPNYGPVNGRPVRTRTYTMHLNMDEEYVRTNLTPNDAKADLNLFTLFCHEVGHGLTMDHDPEMSSVMYPTLEGTKDFDGFFRRVRSFFGIREN